MSKVKLPRRKLKDSEVYALMLLVRAGILKLELT